jgi:hypothetical protein
MTTHVYNSDSHRLHNTFINLVCAAIYIALTVAVSAVYLVSRGHPIQF